MKKLNKETVEKIVELKEESGMSSRQIAKLLGLGKSTVNDVYNRNKDHLHNNKLKITLIDIESMPSVVAAFGRFKQNISQDSVLREGGWIVSYAYKVLGEDEIRGNVLSAEEALRADDSNLCMELWDIIESSDVLIAHNLVSFDLPMIKTRVIVNGLPPIRKVKTVDTLLLAKEFRFNSNKLDSLCRQLDIGEKIRHAGMQLWVQCMEGNGEALTEMYEYNRKDVEILEELYNHVKPYSTRHPNLAINFGDTIRCNVCTSPNVQPTGNTVSTNLSVFEEYVCEECQARFKDRQSTTTKSQRLNFLSN